MRIECMRKSRFPFFFTVSPVKTVGGGDDRPRAYTYYI